MPDQIKIEKGVIIPAPKGGASRQSKYPYKSMEVGDSFFAPGKNARGFSYITQWSKATGNHYISRKVEGGFRIWRTK
jgi:hypothetical protein